MNIIPTKILIQMKIVKTLATVALTVMLTLTACAKTNKGSDMTASDKKAIVCYFSATGTTARAAKRIAEVAGADLHEIVPVEKYTTADLDWTDSMSRSSVEMNNPASRPAISNPAIDLTGYQVIYLGYPNWWNTHPTIINTFIEANNLKGKTIVPFMTSGGSHITNSEKMLRKQYPELTFGAGMLMNGKSDSDIKNWVSQF